MGIKYFSKTFKPTRIVKPKDLSNLTIAIDAMTELFRAALGAKNIATLTDANGNPTLHISVILSNVLAFHKQSVDQIWVFDHDQNPNEDFHNPMKLGELAKRRKRKETALDKIKSMKDLTVDTPLFSDDDDNREPNKSLNKHVDISAVLDEAVLDEELLLDYKPSYIPEIAPMSVEYTIEEIDRMTRLNPRQLIQFQMKKTKQAKLEYDALVHARLEKIIEMSSVKSRLHSLQKQAFAVSTDMINDVKLILNFLHIKYIEAPAKFEGESIASYLTVKGIAHAVFSADTDPIAYGAKILLRRSPVDKLIYEYTQEDILEQIAATNGSIISPTMCDLRKAAMILGTDTCEKTPGVGPKTVLKKLHEIQLSKDQKVAIQEFSKIPDLSSIEIKNAKLEAFVKCDIDGLIDWLVNERNFTRSRVKAQFDKAIAPVKPVARKLILRKSAKLAELTNCIQP